MRTSVTHGDENPFYQLVDRGEHVLHQPELQRAVGGEQLRLQFP